MSIINDIKEAIASGEIEADAPPGLGVHEISWVTGPWIVTASMRTEKLSIKATYLKVAKGKDDHQIGSAITLELPTSGGAIANIKRFLKIIS